MQNFEVLDVGIIATDVELDLGHGHVHVYAVKDLAERGAGEKLVSDFCLYRSGVVRQAGCQRIHSPSTALLDLGHVKLKEAVQPIEKLLSVVFG